MTNVYAWPCVTALGREWTVDHPVSRSRSLITGKEYLSAAQRPRRMAELRVSSLSAGRQGAGYMEALKELLQGGIHAVRLYSFPVNHRDVIGIKPSAFAETVALRTPDLAGEPLRLVTGGDWTTGENVTLFTGAYYSPSPVTLTLLSPNNGMGRANVANLPRSRDIAKVGSFVTVFSPDGTSFETRMLLRPVRSTGSGTASIWTDEPFTAAGNAEFNSRDTGVFRPIDIPRAIKPRSGDWEYAWSFRELFADEVSDGFVEVNPWA